MGDQPLALLVSLGSGGLGLVLVFYGADIAIVGLLALPFPVAPRG